VIRLLPLEELAVVNAAPRGRDRRQPAGLRGLDVERRVADVGRRAHARVELCERPEKWLGVRLLPVRFVARHDDVEEVLDRDGFEGELHGLAPLGSYDPEPPAVRLQIFEQFEHPLARRELRVERRVVLRVDAHQLVDPIRIEVAHL
jgi:hypothetical protein